MLYHNIRDLVYHCILFLRSCFNLLIKAKIDINTRFVRILLIFYFNNIIDLYITVVDVVREYSNLTIEIMTFK